MKIHVIKHYEEIVTGSGRCSDGSYLSSCYTSSVKIFSDSPILNVISANIIIGFIKSNSETGKDRVWDWSFKGETKEEFDIYKSNKLSQLLEKENVSVCENIDDCPYFLNEIAEKIAKSHQLAITKLANNTDILYRNYLSDRDICKGNVGKEAFYADKNAYNKNQLMPDFDEYPLDIARLSNDTDFFEYLLSEGASEVKDSYIFAEWLCKIGKFEYLDKFIDLSKLQIVRVGLPFYDSQVKNYRMTECILSYSIINNRLDIFKKYGRDRFKISINEVIFNENTQNSCNKYVPVGVFAVKYSKLDTIKELFNETTFFVSISTNYYHPKTVLSEDCFRDYETAEFFLNKLNFHSIYAMIYWNKIELIESFIKLNIEQLNKIYLANLYEFFSGEYNSIIEHLARISSFSLIKIPNSINGNLEIPKSSVLDQCTFKKNFDLLTKLFSICIEKETILSFDASRLLYNLFKYFEVEDLMEFNDFINKVLEYIEKEDLMKLIGVSCIRTNLKLLRFLTGKVNNINASFDLEFTAFGLVDTERIDFIGKQYKNGTLLHLSLIANPHELGHSLDIELIKFLLNAGVDKTIKDESGKLPFDYIISGKLFYDSYLHHKELMQLLYVDEIKICSKEGVLIRIFQELELENVKKFKKYSLVGVTAVNAFKKGNKEALDFFLSCGAVLETLKKS